MTRFTNEGIPPAVKVIRLRNGETLIATMQPLDTEYVLEKPMVVVSMPVLNKAGKVERVGVYLRDWIEYSSDTYFSIPKEIVLVMAEPDKKMYDDYVEAKIHSDLQKAQDELKEVMQEYISNIQFPSFPPHEESDKQAESGYTAEPASEEEEGNEDEDEDDGLPWWNGNPRIRF
jgi:hypothetical protein